jgi:hypothetical protein
LRKKAGAIAIGVMPPASEVAPESNGQHLPAISDVDATADMALASEVGRF